MATRRIRTALFVDFDNIFISLEKNQNQPEAAASFARNADRWIQWLEEDGPRVYPEFEDEKVVRRILVRRCYINPKAFGRFRSFFIRSGFEVVDCPVLTTQGKTSADIHMVIDLLDTLGGETRIDEFMILSADADFTPVLLRLRRHDRRTCVLAFGSVSPAYKAAADQILDENEFLEKALGITEEPEPRREKPPTSEVPEELLAKIGERVLEEVDLQATLAGVDLPRLYKEFEAFRQGNDWLGYFSLHAMTRAVVDATPDLEVVEEDPWFLKRRDEEAADEVQSEPDSGLPSLAEVAKQVRETVASASRPVSLAEVANQLVAEFGSEVRETRWLQSGSFKKLIERLDLGALRLSTENPPNLYDPSRHEIVNGRKERNLPEVVRRVCQVTDVPQLTSDEYAVLFRKIAKEVDANGYHLSRTSRNVRDSCHGSGVPVARSHVSFVLKGLAICEHNFDEKQVPWKVAQSFVREVFLLCERAQVDLGGGEEETIQNWLFEAVTAADPEAPDDPAVAG